MPNFNEIADRYMAMWNISDDGERRQTVDEMFTDDAIYTFFNYSPFIGKAAIFKHVTVAHRLYSRAGCSFKSCHNAIGHHDLMRFDWVMHSAAGETTMLGNDVFKLDPEGRIQTDYQFHVRMSAVPYTDLPPLETLFGDVLDEQDLERYRQGLGMLDPGARAHRDRVEAGWSPLR
jgi:hypothetical protein